MLHASDRMSIPFDVTAKSSLTFHYIGRRQREMRRAGCSNPVTWVELARTFSLRALLQLAGFPLGLKAQQKVIDITEQFEETQSREVGGWCVALRYVPIRPFPNHACSFHCTWLSGKSIIQMISVIVIPVFSSEGGLYVNRHGRCGREPAFFVYG